MFEIQLTLIRDEVGIRGEINKIEITIEIKIDINRGGSELEDDITMSQSNEDK